MKNAQGGRNPLSASARAGKPVRVRKADAFDAVSQEKAGNSAPESGKRPGAAVHVRRSESRNRAMPYHFGIIGIKNSQEEDCGHDWRYVAKMVKKDAAYGVKSPQVVLVFFIILK